MSARGRTALALGALTYVGAWAFGSRPLYPVAVGLLLAVALAAAAVRLPGRRVVLHRRVDADKHLEGEDVTVRLELEGLAPAPISVSVHEGISGAGENVAALRRVHGRYVGEYVLERLPRGRYAFEDVRAVIEDPFGLQRLELALESAREPIFVYPRLVELGRLFSETGAVSEGKRLLLRRQSGFDLHSVREYAQGESLRRVHWPSTAKRAQLMVKELEDAPRDDVAVILDASADAVAGERGDSSFDVQVRAAGSILAAHARRGRRALLATNGADLQVLRVHGGEGDWAAALQALAAAEPAPSRPLASALASGGPTTQAAELALVTAALPASVVEALTRQATRRKSVSVVYVDRSSFVARARQGPPAETLRLAAAGIAVAVIRRGDDLAERLGAAVARESAHG